MQIENDFSSYLSNLWKSIRNCPGAILINSKKAAEISDSVSVFAGKLDTPCVLYRVVAEEGMTTLPYYPLVSIIADKFRGMSPEKVTRILDIAGIYHYQKDVLRGFFLGMPQQRKEELIFDEIHYEKARMLEALASISDLASNGHDLIISIENIHYLSASSFEMMRYLLEKNVDRRVLIVFTFDKEHVFANEEGERIWNEFLEYVSKKFSMLDDNESDFIAAEKKSAHSSLEEKVIRPENFCLLKKACTEDVLPLMDLADINLNFLAFYECREYCQCINDNYIRHTVSIEDAQYTRLLEMLGDCSRYLNDKDSALVYYNTVFPRLQKDQRYGDISYLYHKMAFIYWEKDSKDIAQKLSVQSMKFAEKHGTDEQKALSYFTNMLVETDLIVIHEMFETKYRAFFEELIRLLKECRFENHLSYVCTLGPYLLSLLHNNYIEFGFQLCHEGIEIAQRNNNIYRRAQATHIEGMLYQDIDDWGKALASYKKSQELRILLEDYTELARSCNGIGYFYFTTEEYSEAHGYYVKALAYLMQSPKPEYVEIAATLFNISLLYYYTFKYNDTIDLMEKLLSIMNILKLENLPYVPLFDIYSVLGMSYLMSGNRIKAFEFIKKTSNLPALKVSGYRSEYFEYFRALFYYDAEDVSRSNELFYAALSVIKKSNRVFDFLLMHTYYTFGSILQTQGNQDEVKLLVAEGLGFSGERRHPYHRSLLRSLLNRLESPVPVFTFPDIGFNHKAVLHEIEHVQDMNRLYKRMEEINFLNNLQITLAKSADRHALSKEVCALIETVLNIEISLISYNSGIEGVSSEIFSAEEQLPENEERAARLLSYLDKKVDEEKLYSSLRNTELGEFAEFYTSVLYIPFEKTDMRSGSLLCCSKHADFSFTTGDQRVLSIAAKQIWIALQRIEMTAELELANIRLRKAAITDGLTELLNKDQLLKKIAEEMKRTNRYHSKDSSVFSIVFIDLDNFKYYNDTFGHNVGDMILRKFAEILKDNSRDVDTVYRFGGDEFVILMAQTGSDGAQMMSERIFDDMKNQDYFVPFIQTRISSTVSIPEEFRIGCSVGITEYHRDKNCNIDEILEEADKALYQAKKDGKNRYRIYREEKTL